jgi:hypothetical protein
MPGAFAINTHRDQTLMHTPANGDPAVLIFTSHARAAKYIGERRLEPMHPLELTPLTVNLWISKMRLNGVRIAIIDPTTAARIGNGRRGTLDAIREIVLQDDRVAPKSA